MNWGVSSSFTLDAREYSQKYGTELNIGGTGDWISTEEEEQKHIYAIEKGREGWGNTPVQLLRVPLFDFQDECFISHIPSALQVGKVRNNFARDRTPLRPFLPHRLKVKRGKSIFLFYFFTPPSRHGHHFPPSISAEGSLRDQQIGLAGGGYFH